MDTWQLLIFLIFPIGSVILVFFIKRKILWISPIVSTVLSVVYSILVMPSILTVPERSIFWRITIPLQLVIAIIFTVVAYIISWLLNKRKFTSV